VRVLDACLRMLHPFTPFVTEELWGHLKKAAQAHSSLFAPKGGWEEALIIAHWPEPRYPEGWEELKIADFNLVMNIVRAIRNLRSEKKLQPNKRIHATIVARTALHVLQDQYRSIAALACLDPQGFILVDNLPKKPREGTASLVVSGVEIFLPLADLVDVETERARLQKELSEVQSQIERLEKLLNSDFAQKAPVAVVEKERQKLATYLETSRKIANQVSTLA
jgi:valyl-tRNA synthetase